MSPAECREHHRREMQSVGYRQGAEGIARYRKQHPDATGVGVKLQALGYVTKPKGYADCLAQLVSHWLDSDTALASTNAADVGRLNERLGSNFSEANHFSKPLSGFVLTGIAKACADRGISLDKAANSMAKIRKAVRAGKAMATPGATLVAGLGYRHGNTLSKGSQSFAIAPHNGHDCIRISVDGQRVRLRLDALSAFASEAGLGSDIILPIYSDSYTGETVPEPGIDPLEACHEISGATSTGDCEVGLSGRIAALCQPDRRAPSIDGAIDPLEF